MGKRHYLCVSSLPMHKPRRALISFLPPGASLSLSSLISTSLLALHLLPCLQLGRIKYPAF